MRIEGAGSRTVVATPSGRNSIDQKREGGCEEGLTEEVLGIGTVGTGGSGGGNGWEILLTDISTRFLAEISCEAHCVDDVCEGADRHCSCF
jgi:hypothetical protein